MNIPLQNSLLLAGRVLAAFIFIGSGIDKILHYEGSAAYMASGGVPLVALLLPIAILFELGGGLALALGWKARWAALALVLFTLPATLIFHAFWAAPAAEAGMQQIHFLKNLSIIGGLLGLIVSGGGAWALDRGANAK
ncbi:MAG: hypothetical protein A3H91_06130 [Gammaproteobacteria bacterium RIFCSPLOWO2_02_FULL_61_13]|nr:MAG: hypothetical protein A3H91_06130 [Gammaproteobacteria bacterium RIFCSPLOWO2_02_FULL_61_13]